MKILKYKKMSKGRYKVTFDTNELILYEDVIIKNNLLAIKDVTLQLLEKIIEENKHYEVYDVALSYIDIKMRCVSELKDYLEKKSFDSIIIDEVIERLITEGYLNEKRYIEAYINDKISLTNLGPYKIKRNLIDLSLPENLIDDYLSIIDYNVWKEKLQKIINKRVSLMKNKSIMMIKNKLKVDLFNLGYQNELIEELLNNINKDDEASLKKEYTKAYTKYSKKYNDQSLNTKIKNHLYKKGYNIDDINQIINESN